MRTRSPTFRRRSSRCASPARPMPTAARSPTPVRPTGAAAGGGEIRRVEPTHKATIAWEAADPNNDVLEYSLYFRQGTSEPWILLKDKLLERPYEWDTRAVADGRYEIKVVASDANANPPGLGKTASRVSNPFAGGQHAASDRRHQVAAERGGGSHRSARRWTARARSQPSITALIQTAIGSLCCRSMEFTTVPRRGRLI